MTTNRPTPIVIPDVPLPGMYDCLTLQLNLTLHPRAGTAKWVCTLRDPSPTRQVELSRQGGIVTADQMLVIVGRALTENLNGMLFLASVEVTP